MLEYKEREREVKGTLDRKYAVLSRNVLSCLLVDTLAHTVCFMNETHRFSLDKNFILEGTTCL